MSPLWQCLPIYVVSLMLSFNLWMMGGLHNFASVSTVRNVHYNNCIRGMGNAGGLMLLYSQTRKDGMSGEQDRGLSLQGNVGGTP